MSSSILLSIQNQKAPPNTVVDTHTSNTTATAIQSSPPPPSTTPQPSPKCDLCQDTKIVTCYLCLKDATSGQKLGICINSHGRIIKCSACLGYKAVHCPLCQKCSKEGCNKGWVLCPSPKCRSGLFFSASWDSKASGLCLVCKGTSYIKCEYCQY